ncbi:MAG: hypothetical protein HZB33_02945 [Nitrospirae bacterium]|nr:hypothetical protein [Nitrospirota bacterium]
MELKVKQSPVCLILVIFLFSVLAPVQAGTSSVKYQRVSSILSQVTQTADLPDTGHKNPRVVKAVGLFLEASEPENLSDDDLHGRFRSLFPLPLWKEWVPQFEIKKVKKGLYLVSLGSAAVTQASSLYLFQGASHLKIDSGDLGLIYIENIHATDSQIEVTYLRTPGSTRPERVTASLQMRAGVWRVEPVKKL